MNCKAVELTRTYKNFLFPKDPKEKQKVKDEQKLLAEDSGGSFWEPPKDQPPEPLMPRPRQGSNFETTSEAL